MTKLEFFYDCSSPWTYLGFSGVIPIAERFGIEIEWRPILVGGVFNAFNPDLYEARERMFANEARVQYMMTDLKEWADYRGISIRWPEFHLKVNSVKMMRACLVAQEQDRAAEYSRRLFEAYWGEHDVSAESALCAIAGELGMDEQAFGQRLAAPEIKQRLRDNTDELVARGGYGSPTLFVDTQHMYFGNDRLPLLERRLETASDS
jgi:2-hydroxychromene-2-carboxylate isomerase